MTAIVNPWKERAEYERLRELAAEREFVLDQSDVAEYVSLNVGLNHDQSTNVVLHAEGEHATIGAVHVSLVDGKVVVGIEVEPGMDVEVRPIVRRRRWRFYDFWHYDKEKRDNFIMRESEWPTEPTLIGVEA